MPSQTYSNMQETTSGKLKALQIATKVCAVLSMILSGVFAFILEIVLILLPLNAKVIDPARTFAGICFVWLGGSLMTAFTILLGKDLYVAAGKKEAADCDRWIWANFNFWLIKALIVYAIGQAEVFVIIAVSVLILEFFQILIVAEFYYELRKEERKASARVAVGQVEIAPTITV